MLLCLFLFTSMASLNIFTHPGLQIYGGPGSLSHDFKIWPKAVGPVDPSFLVVKKSHFNKKYLSYSESTNSTNQKVHVEVNKIKQVLSSH